MITGPQIKAARTLLGWSLRDLARRTGIDISGIQELEGAAKMPNRRRNDLALVQTIWRKRGSRLSTRSGSIFGRWKYPGRSRAREALSPTRRTPIHGRFVQVRGTPASGTCVRLGVTFPKRLRVATGAFCFCRQSSLPDHCTLARVSPLCRPTAHIPPQYAAGKLLHSGGSSFHRQWRASPAHADANDLGRQVRSPPAGLPSLMGGLHRRSRSRPAPVCDRDRRPQPTPG
jgi:hypothetical protein